VALCGLLAPAPVWAETRQQYQFQTDLFRDGHPQTEHKRWAAHPVDPALQLRHTMRDEINSGLVGIVSEGTDYTVDLALALASGQAHLRLLPIAGAGALQNAKDVTFARGVDFAILQTDVLDEIKRNPPFPGIEDYLQYVTRLYDQDLHVLTQISSRSKISKEKRLISGCATAGPIRLRRLFSVLSRSSPM
jgi:hypothetical protein